jgi:thioredoxin 1
METRSRSFWQRLTGGAAPTQAGPAAGEGAVLHATDASFSRLVLEHDGPVLVDFWAPWCAPCRAVAPALEELAREHAGRARIVKVDVDQCPRTASAYGIRSIPTLALFRGGEQVEVLVGLQSKERLGGLLARAELH